MRRVLLVGLVSIVGITLFSGCYWARMHKVKKQLGDFDEYFEIQDEQDISITFAEPVLLEKDMIRTLGSEPVERKEIDGRIYHYYFAEKVYPDGMSEEGDHDLDVNYIFCDGKLCEIMIDERVGAIYPKEMLIGIYRALGRGKIDIFSRSIKDATYRVEKLTMYNQDEIRYMLGEPYSVDGNNVEYKYRQMYKNGEDDNYICTINYVFDEKGRIRKLKQDLIEPSGGDVDFTRYWQWKDDPNNVKANKEKDA